MHLSRIPSGLRYYVGEAARRRRAVEDCAISVFAGWSYEEITTPTLDYYSLFEQGMGAEAQTSFRFVDADGGLLALRPDVTSSVARACATLLAEKPRPVRLCYVAPVFHQHPRTKAEWRRETTQLGCELIGAAGSAADIEPLAILAETLNRLGLESNYCITINNVEIFNGIAEHLRLNEESRERLRSLIDLRDTSGLTELLDGLGVNARERELFVEVTRLAGKQPIINEARHVITNSRSRAALESLAQTWNAIETLGLSESFEIDLGDVSGLDYYTGLLCKVYVRGSGVRVGRGGRYDGLTSKFGRAEAATGFVLDLDELTSVVERSEFRIQTQPAPTCQKPDRQGGQLAQVALPDGRASDTHLSEVVEIGLTDTASTFQEALRRRADNQQVRIIF